MMPQSKIRFLSLASITAGAAAFVLPRMMASNEGGFAPATSAALLVLACLCVAFVFAIAAMIVTRRNYHSLPALTKTAGIAPVVLLGLALVTLVIFILT